MPTINFRKNRPALNVPKGANLMKALMDAKIPVASSCRGDAVCAKCRIEIVAGAENLSPENDAEAFLRQRHSVPKKERISCQVEVLGDITIDAAYW
jgi:ferredoxin, 2Fe-2S